LRKTQEYGQEEDVLGQWLAQECELAPEAEVTGDALFQSWERWCHARGDKTGGKQTTLTRQLKARKLPIQHTQVGERRKSGFRGIRLRDRAEGPDDEFAPSQRDDSKREETRKT
jgi:phage/plasmid-associated DNA primase